MPMPAGAVSPVDASLQSQFTLSSVEVTDGGQFDTITGGWSGNNAVVWDSISCGNGPCIFHGGRGAPIYSTPTWLSNPSLAIGIPFTIVAVVRGDQYGTICELSADVGSGRGVEFRDGGGWTARINGPTALSYNDHGDGQFWGCRNEIHCYILTCDGTTTQLYVDGALVTNLSRDGVAPGTGSFSVASTIGAAHGGIRPLTGAIGLLYPYTHAFSASERTQTLAYVNGIWRLTPRANQGIKYNVLVVGDSIGAGTHTQSETYQNLNAPFAFTQIACTQLGARFGTATNYAVSGAQLGQTPPNIKTYWDNNGKPSTASGKTNIVVVQGGINDLGGGATVNQTNANLQAVVQDVSAYLSSIASGAPQYVVVVTITGATNSVNAASVNSNTRANYTSWGASGVTMLLADVGNDPVIAQNVNGTYYNADTLHPVKPGHQRMGTILANTLIAAGL